MRDEVFSFLASLLRERAGLSLSRDKEYLLESRLAPLARKRGHESVEALTQELRTGRDRQVEREIIEAMTTNESLFFRDAAAFTVFRDAVLPPLLQARTSSRKLRLWFAACSSGQEPYSVAMLLEEERARLAAWDIELVATDLSTEMIQRSQEGLYSHFEVQRGLPIQMLAKYFQKEERGWRIKEELKERVKFRAFNLLDDFGVLGFFDVIFCRNVLIYFDLPTKRNVLRRLGQSLARDGALFLGGAETVIGVSDKFAPHPGHAGIFVPLAMPALGRAVGS